jgi:hypothetical protein
MAKKTLNAENLEQLGAARLAALVMDLVQGSAALQRRARMELSAAQGPKEVAADLRKRFASLRRSTSYVDWRKQKAFVKDLTGLVAMIETGVAPFDADEAFDLTWSFLQLAPAIHVRTDDSNGAVGEVMGEAMKMLARISPRLTVKPALLAERILEAVAEAGYGEFDGIIPAMAEVLGPDGLNYLKAITEAWAVAPPSPQDVAQFRGYGGSTSPVESARRQRKSTASIILADIADLQGDVDAYMARYSAEQLTYGTIAPDVARRLIDAGRLEEALGIIQRARAAEEGKSFRASRYELDAVYEDCLQRMGKLDDLKSHLWVTFQQTLYAGSLRKYLKLLPDFDDIEAEEKALALAETYPHLGAAIHFLTVWPDLVRAARVIIARAGELDGNAYETLTAAADALEPHHPLAATLLRRAMLKDTLEGAKSKRYRHAARHLEECRACAAFIQDFAGFPSHAEFLAGLKLRHGRKYGFWEIVDG